jgi:hypothetical protein
MRIPSAGILQQRRNGEKVEFRNVIHVRAALHTKNTALAQRNLFLKGNFVFLKRPAQGRWGAEKQRENVCDAGDPKRTSDTFWIS